MTPKEQRLINVLKEIAKCEGAYNMDRLTHAGNVIQNMKELALNAIQEEEEK